MTTQVSGISLADVPQVGSVGFPGPKGDVGDVNPQMPILVAAAEDAATAAQSAQSAAETARGQAQTAQAAAESARDLALSYQTAAQGAAAAAGASEIAAGGARTAAEAARDTAQGHATTASGAATTATTQAGIATTKAGEAAAALADLKGRWYGPLASDPTLDPNGAAVGTGDAYWNTTSSQLRVYSGSAWVPAFSDASLVAYTSSFSGSIATTVKAFLDRITSLDNGSAAHVNGATTITGSPRWFIGNNAPSADDSALLIGRGLTGSYVTGAHAIRDETTYNSSGSGLHAYASFDAIPTLGGSVSYNHLHAYQARPAYSGSGPMDQIVGHTFQANHAGAGTVTSVIGYKVSDANGSGVITSQYGILIENLTRGASNYAFYSGSSSLPSYHGGKWQMGTAPQITAAGFTTYGAILSHDTTGNVISNPNFKISNGLLTMGNATTSRILSSVAFTLQLDAVGVVETQKPLKFPVYTVATLPAPASSYSYCRAFVSDADATTFNSIVAGGGSNKVPVFCDGTNWRIG